MSAVPRSALSEPAPAPGEPAEPLALVTRDGPVARVTLNRPAQFNALSEAMLDALAALRRDGVRATLAAYVAGMPHR